MLHRQLPSASLLPLVLAFLLASACSSDKGAQQPDELASARGPHYEQGVDEEGLIVEYLDADGDGNPDIIRYFEEYEDPREKGRIRRRLRRMELDVNGDGQINVRRFYDEYGNVAREENDVNLDGNMNQIIYFMGGEIARKEILHPTKGYVQERRVYFDGNLVRVEKDTTGRGAIDTWEYYEDGVLMRIGRDTVGDGSADTWQLR